ncbi:SAM-dependent methyltransferase [Nakamurella sp. UYEF19]|uniref:hypothetical protein n=1 Tax=Nakamurella sp. UYEF19 TaxID=1756392 RepID=UPI00339997DB
MIFPVRPLSGRWPAWLERSAKRFFWDDPRALLDENVSAELFRRLMAAVHVGDTIKITEANRHPMADTLLIESLDLTDASIVDIGCSDGSTSVDLIAKLPTFGTYTMADLYFHLDTMTVGRTVYFYDPDGSCILMSGRRFVAWPTQSKLIRLLSQPLIRRAAQRRGEHRQVLLLNPDARALMAGDERITYRVHDVFTPWEGARPDIIKVANLLRRFYFDDEKLMQGVLTILRVLPEGGHFLVVDNGRDGFPPRAGLYRRVGDSFGFVGNSGLDPEIHDLITQVSVATA